MKIDVFPHIVPVKYRDAIFKKMPDNSNERKVIEAYPSLTDLDVRFRIMDKYEDLVQVLTAGAPPLEDVVKPEDAIDLARIANDEMAELVSKYPDRFVAAVANLPMNNIDAALIETDRAINDLRFRGVQIYSDINGRPLDSPEFMPLYEKMTYYNLPLFIHPVTVSNAIPDYPNEKASKYLIHLIFGWPYRTTLAMTRLAMGGIFERYPDLKIITHHGGAMVPFLQARIRSAFLSTEMRWGLKQEPHLSKQPLDYFRMFYVDTAIYNNPSGLMCSYDFYGASHMLFGTDMPYDAQIGDFSIRECIQAVEKMNVADLEKKMIFEDNAREILRLPI